MINLKGCENSHILFQGPKPAFA